MTRKAWPAAALAMLLVVGCAGPEKLARVSQDRLAKGDMWRAWTLATKALDKAPGNGEAKRAAAAAAASISDDWRRRIRAHAETDTIGAAEQILEFDGFRTSATRYTTVPVDMAWAADESAIRLGASSLHYRQGIADMASQRPKRA